MTRDADEEDTLPGENFGPHILSPLIEYFLSHSTSIEDVANTQMSVSYCLKDSLLVDVRPVLG